MSENNQQTVMAVAQAHDAGTMMGFQNLASFEFMQRAAKLFASSTMVPSAYQAIVSEGYGREKKWVQNDAALPNCMVALDLAQRMNASPLQVMQNLHVIEGRPSWGSPFIIALINNSGHYQHGLRFDFEWLDDMDAKQIAFEWINNVKQEVVKTVPIKNARCIAWTLDKSGARIESAPVTLEMAVQEGWYTRNGSKWRTMPQTMAQYRAAAFFGRTYNPELLMGLPTAEELHDIIDVTPQADGSLSMQAAEPEHRAPRAPRAKPQAPAAEVVAETTQARAAEPAPGPTPEPTPAPAAVDQETGEVLPIVNAELDTATADLFDAAAPAVEVAPTPAPEPVPEKKPRVTKPTPAPAPAPAAAAPATPATTVPSAPPLTVQKIAFVKAQLDTTGGKTTAQFVEQFRKQPDDMNTEDFKAFLAWINQK
jgi:hypothetical protein